MNATIASASTVAPWDAAHFRSCVVYRRRREVTCDGVAQSIEPRAFDILLHLIEHRHAVVSKSDLMEKCWAGDVPSDSALARAIMKIRRAIGDADPDAPMIRTVHGMGYQFVCAIELRASDAPSLPPTSADASVSQARRLALLPIANATSDNSCGWVELGLMSLIAKVLQTLPDTSIVPIQDVFAALRGIGAGDSPETRLAAIESALGAVDCVWGELSGIEARFVLHFNLRTSGTHIHRGTVVGSDPAKLATDAALHLRQWLAPDSLALTAAQTIDLGEPFLNQVFARALQCSREERLNEAEHLLAVLQESGVHHMAVLHETAKVLLALGRPGAEERLRELDAIVQETGSPALRAVSRSLHGTHLELQGRIAEAIAATLEAVDIAEEHGYGDMTARLLVTCASRMAMGFDERANALLSQAILRAERLSNRIVLCDAYCAAGRVAGFRNDWNSALHHQLAAVAIAETMHEASRSWAYGALSWVQTELGQLDEAAKSAAAAFRTARMSGAEPQQGLAAGQAALAYLACRRIRDTAELFGTLQGLTADASVSMLVAREAYCRVMLLGVTGHVDEALARLADVSEVASHHPRLMSRCEALRLRVLLHAKRFDELEAACAAIRESPTIRQDVRLEPLIAHALAFRDHFERGETAAAITRLSGVGRAQAASEVHAVISLDTAWLHLERGEVDEAAAMTAPLQAWLEQSQPGLMVAGRLHHARGDWDAALATHRECMRRFPDVSTEFQRALLDTYERAARDRRADAIAPLNDPITLHWQVAPHVLRELPAALGGASPA
ncbi:MAG TPA: winged helix-turn-helix domain-containing protein [Burkholderiaceae bacterium]|nr:winged helix-turn-helix domain-containing protein [Burkholderiaceae bacterium]